MGARWRIWAAAAQVLVMGATMAIAPLWDELVGEEDLFGEPLSVSYGGSPAGGVPFLTDHLGADARVMVEAAFGADLTSTEPQTWNWYDITADVRQADSSKVSISPVGRADETSQAQPAGCSFQLDNTSGAYSAYNPASRWYPYVRRNTPVRVRVYVNGAWSTRFQGYANGWVPSWDTSANLAVVSVSASGVLRRLAQGKSPLRSALYRSINSTGAAAYWPLEDGTSATQGASTVSGVPAMAEIKTGVSFGSATGPAGSDSIVDFSSGGALQGVIPSTATSLDWRIFFVAKLNLTGSDLATIMGWTMAGSRRQWELQADLNGVYVVVYNADGSFSQTQVFTSFSAANFSDNAMHRVRIDQVSSGPYIQVHIDEVLNDIPVDMTGQTLGQVTTITADPTSMSASVNKHPVAFGHLAFWAPFGSTVDINSAYSGHSGETATARMTRLCGEEDIPITIGGSSATTMGAQSVDTLLNLIRECETADDGLLFDGLGPGLTYIPRTARYNAATSLTADLAHDPPQVADPFTPTDDDQRNRNLVKVDRKNGSSGTYQDTTGTLGTNTIGTYDSSVTVNHQDDHALYNRAAWEVHKGTVEGFRYPTLNLDLAANPELAGVWLATTLSQRVDVTNVSSKATQHPAGTVSVLLEGYTETLSPFDWTIAANCSQYRPWQVFQIGDTQLGRLDTGGSALAASAASGSTSLSVATTGTKLWTTTATFSADFPFDVEISGIQVTVTAITGTSSPQTFTVTGVTKDLHVGDTVKLWKPGVIAL